MAAPTITAVHTEVIGDAFSQGVALVIGVVHVEVIASEAGTGYHNAGTLTSTLDNVTAQIAGYTPIMGPWASSLGSLTMTSQPSRPFDEQAFGFGAEGQAFNWMAPNPAAYTPDLSYGVDGDPFNYTDSIDKSRLGALRASLGNVTAALAGTVVGRTLAQLKQMITL